MLQTLIVVDAIDNVELDATVLTFEQYLAEYPKREEPKTRIINLCDTQQYLSRGYYCSLLAEARKHKVFPSVTTINDLRDATFNTLMLGQFDNDMPIPTSDVDILVCFGYAADSKWQVVAHRVFERYPAPLLRITIPFASDPSQAKVECLALAQLNLDERSFFDAKLQSFTNKIDIREFESWGEELKFQKKLFL